MDNSFERKINKKRIWWILGILFVILFLIFLLLYEIYCYKKKQDYCSEYTNYLPSEKNLSLDYSYSGQLNNEKRYLSIGFDDFRDSDFDVVIPLFNDYGFKATFNRIGTSIELSADDIERINQVIYGGHELGDHTWLHRSYIYMDPYCNGQDPSNIDGNQNPYPSNEQMRGDRGDGCNEFGFDLNEPVIERLRKTDSYIERQFDGYDESVIWGKLTDEQCQNIRNEYSLYSNKDGMLSILDELSNRYLGTKGASHGSFDEELGEYTGGIYSGCRTSANHEVWERILEITQKYYEEQYGINYKLQTWSWPGSYSSPFIYEKDGNYFYDKECSIYYNFLARMESSLYKKSDGLNKCRSFTECLREYGYSIAHDTMQPTRRDGQEKCMMDKQLIYNAYLSRRDALPYRTNNSISYEDIANAYPEDFFDDASNKDSATQMYESGGAFYTFIESIRNDTSNGMIHGEIIDSVDSYSERVFLAAMLEYCKQTGVEVITKATAYDICFNYKLDTGNMIYNPYFRNTAREFMPEADNVPDNPDGYIGDCTSYIGEDTIPVLQVNGQTRYLHYGIPIGKICFKADIKGNGNISIYAIKNSDSTTLDIENLEKIAQIDTDNMDFENKEVDFLIRNNPMTEYDQLCEGLGDKIMGIMIVYSEGLEVKNIVLEKQ